MNQNINGINTHKISIKIYKILKMKYSIYVIYL